MIGHDDIPTAALSFPEGSFGLPTAISLNDKAIDALQEAGLLGMSADKRRAAIRNLSPETIKDIQTKLVDAGFKDVGAIDGIAGRNTLKGIEQALAKNTLTEILAESDASGQETVRRIQESLNTLGHNAGKVDGAFGPVTAKALGAFVNGERMDAAALPENIRGKLAEHNIQLNTQTAVGIPPDLILQQANPALLEVLGAYEQTEDDIKLLQGFLKEKGYNVGSVDGDFGPVTTRQFVKFLEENPAYHSAIGPNLLLETEIYAMENEVSPELRRSLNLRDLTKMPTPDDNIRYQAYKDYFASEGKPEELARGIKVASELTGVPMEKLFVVMKQESINFGDYNPAHGNSSANRIANNYGQFTNQTLRHMNENYADDARRELGREGIHINSTDWRSDPLVAPYMVAKYLQETGSYPAYVLPAMRGKDDSNAIVARQYPEAARSNRHIFYEGGKPVSFSKATEKIMGTLEDDFEVEREIVISAQRESLKRDLLARQPSDTIYLDDRIDLRKHGIDVNRTAGLVGDDNNPEAATARLNFAGSFRQATLMNIADIAPDPNGKGPRPSGWTPSPTDLG